MCFVTIRTSSSSPPHLEKAAFEEALKTQEKLIEEREEEEEEEEEEDILIVGEDEEDTEMITSAEISPSSFIEPLIPTSGVVDVPIVSQPTKPAAEEPSMTLTSTPVASQKTISDIFSNWAKQDLPPPKETPSKKKAEKKGTHQGTLFI